MGGGSGSGSGSAGDERYERLVSLAGVMQQCYPEDAAELRAIAAAVSVYGDEYHLDARETTLVFNAAQRTGAARRYLYAILSEAC